MPFVVPPPQECLASTHGQVWGQARRRGLIMLELEQRTSELSGSTTFKASEAKRCKKWVLHISLAALSYPRYILGGIHMTNPAFLPNALLKEITGTEYTTKIPSFFNDNHNLTELDRQQARIFELANKPSWLKRIDPVSSVTDIVSKLPWWLECNPARYPYWFGQSDPRNELLLKAMQSRPSRQNSNTLKISDIIVWHFSLSNCVLKRYLLESRPAIRFREKTWLLVNKFCNK